MRNKLEMSAGKATGLALLLIVVALSLWAYVGDSIIPITALVVLIIVIMFVPAFLDASSSPPNNQV